MDLPVMPPVAPMLARAVKGVPTPSTVRGGLSYEPKWDGFRCIIFRDGDEVELASRNLKPITRYFPEVVAAVLAQTPQRCVLDGEIVLARGGRLDFEALQQRIHPADSRVRRLATETPAALVVFDVLALGEEDLQREPHAARRERLLSLRLSGPGVFTTPATQDAAVARQWFDSFEGAGLDGIVAKPLDGVYAPGGRTMLKVKHERTADCVLAGYRLHKGSTPQAPLLGSLLLGLYDDEGTLQSVGVAASFPMARRAALIGELAPLETGVEDHPWAGWAEVGGGNGGGSGGAGGRGNSGGDDAGAGQRRPGAVSRWSTGKDLSFVPLRPERVVEVAYDHMEGTRFRHTTQFRRWREDREPSSCTYTQLEEPVKYDLATLLPGAE